MSGGPQVFLGATTFLSRCRQISGRREACPPARLGNRASLGASSRSPARPCRPRGGLQSGGGPPARRSRCELRSARRLEARPCPPVPPAPSTPVGPGVLTCCLARRLVVRPGPAGLVMTGYSTMSHVIPLHVFQTLKSHRWNCNVLRESRKLTDVNYVRLLFWLMSWTRRTDDETPLADAVRSLWPTQVRPPSASTAPRQRTRRSPPR